MIADTQQPISTDTFQEAILERDLEILRLKRRIQSLERNARLEKQRLQNPRGRLSELIGIGQGVYGATPEEADAYLNAERDSWES
jgi:hypothetical protein